MSWQKRIDAILEKKREAKAIRTRVALKNSAGRFLYLSGRRFYNFSTNDYLGLSQHPVVINAWKHGAELYGIGSGGSGHISGYTPVHQQLEEELADWLGYQSALLFTSGFAANQALIRSLATSDDFVIADRLSHASLLEAASLSPARLRRFSHNNVSQLRVLLDKPCIGQRLVVTEGIFSMDGDAAPLTDILSSAKSRKAWTLVDDAHGIGVVGEQGRGSISIHNVHPELLVITFGKGFGVSGAAVLCTKAVAEYLLQFSRHLIYSTNIPPALALAILASLKVISGDDGVRRRQRLAERIQQFRAISGRSNYQFSDSHSAIQPLILGDNAQTLRLAGLLRNYGIWVTPIRPPTVPKGKSRLRFTLTATHEPEDIEVLLEALDAVCR